MSNKTNSRKISSNQIKEFRQKGFVVLKRFFTKAVMEKISAHLDKLRDEEPMEGQEAKYYEESPITGEHILVRIENILGDHNTELTDLLLPPDAMECLTDLLGEPPVLFKEKINYKLPGCRADKLHQDQAAGWNAYGDFYISMGIAVDKNRKENAALSFMNSGNYERKLMSKEWEPLSKDDPPYTPKDEYVLLEADPGDVIFFDAFVPHGSPPNTSNKSRRNIFLTFNRESDGNKRIQYYKDKWSNYAPNQKKDARSNKSFRV